MSSKSKDKIRVSFKSSGAAEDVTGSCIIITWGKPQRTIMVDCGLSQGGQSLLKGYQANNKRFSVKESTVEYIFVTHAHADHQGLVPLLFKRGCEGKVIVPEKSKDIVRELQLDSAKIMERDALDLSKRTGKNYPPIYAKHDVDKAIEHTKEYGFNKKIELDEELSFELIPAGHTLGSAQIILYIKNGGSVKKLAFTGDLGNINTPKLYINDFKPIQNANLLIGECTYANKERSIKAKDRKKDEEKIKSVIQDIMDNGKGSVLFPVFSFMRSQQILTIIYNLFKDDENFNIPVIMASPLTSKINKIFSEELEGEELRKWEEILSWDKLTIISEFEKLENHMKQKTPTIVLASSGMMNAGFSIWVAEQLLPSAYNKILFCGYSVEGTLAWKIKQKKTKTVTINGKAIPSRCGIVNLHSFSSHMQREELMKYYSGGMGTGTYCKVALNHGNFKDKCEFGKELQEEISKRNRTDKVVIVNKSTEILL